MNMQINCCKGCFYVGTANGFKPECNCHKVAEAETRANDMVDFWDQYFEDDTVSDFTDTKDRSKAVRRRINKAKANKKAVEILPIVEFKFNKVPCKPSAEITGNIARKKCASVKRSAKRRYQAEIVIPFPKIHGKKHYGRRLKHLTTLFTDWQHTATFCNNNEMALACENAITTLETAIACGGELVSLHREGNDMYVGVGFWDKVSMLNFNRKISPIN